MRCLLFILSGLVACFLVGCGESHSSHGDHDGHAHGAGHVHVAPHGGTLVEIGEHAFNVEFVRDFEAGKLTAYILDGHAEAYVRLPAPSLDILVTRSGQPETVKLVAVANSQTGEKVGDTSQFEITSEWLKDKGPLSGEIQTLEIRGSKFAGVKFQLPGKS